MQRKEIHRHRNKYREREREIENVVRHLATWEANRRDICYSAFNWKWVSLHNVNHQTWTQHQVITWNLPFNRHTTKESERLADCLVGLFGWCVHELSFKLFPGAFSTHKIFYDEWMRKKCPNTKAKDTHLALYFIFLCSKGRFLFNDYHCLREDSRKWAFCR